MKTIWIVDGAYLFNFGKATPFDYLKLKSEIERHNGAALHECYLLNASQDPSAEAQNAFYTWLKSAAPKGPKFRVQLYRLKDLLSICPNCQHSFARQVQQGVDVAIATLLIKLAVRNAYDRLIFSAGDGDFEGALAYVKADLGKEIWINGSQGTLSADLQSCSDRVLWLEDMLPVIARWGAK